jgi:hypothetical protein
MRLLAPMPDGAVVEPAQLTCDNPQRKIKRKFIGR